jgi:SAM-dependent methyltransferase
MAHFQQQRFVQEVKARFPEFFTRAKVLEVGSWDLNGNVRGFFEGCEYVGTDVAPGRGVDLAVAGQDLDFQDGAFDVVISCECFEHNRFWPATFLNMARMLRPGGLFVLTCAGIGRGEHGTSRTDASVSLSASQQHDDYYGNLSRNDFVRRIDLEALFSHYDFFDNRYSKDLYFVGLKHTAPDGAIAPMAEPTEQIATLRRAVRRITVAKRLTLVRAVGAHAEWWLKWALAQLLGEQAYHDLRHILRPRTSPDRKVPASAP